MNPHDKNLALEACRIKRNTWFDWLLVVVFGLALSAMLVFNI